MSSLQEDAEFVPSSNPDSLNELDLDEIGGISIDSEDPCQETFSKMSHIEPENERKGSLSILTKSLESLEDFIETGVI